MAKIRDKQGKKKCFMYYLYKYIYVFCSMTDMDGHRSNNKNLFK